MFCLQCGYVWKLEDSCRSWFSPITWVLQTTHRTSSLAASPVHWPCCPKHDVQAEHKSLLPPLPQPILHVFATVGHQSTSSPCLEINKIYFHCHTTQTDLTILNILINNDKILRVYWKLLLMLTYKVFWFFFNYMNGCWLSADEVQHLLSAL